ncbi:hypothetical protein AB9M75_12475 [Lactobacillus sp. AN1001]
MTKNNTEQEFKSEEIDFLNSLAMNLTVYGELLSYARGKEINEALLKDMTMNNLENAIVDMAEYVQKRSDALAQELEKEMEK